jgi:hypothetical protein
MKPKEKRKRGGVSNTQRTIHRLRKQGWDCDVVERWIPIKMHPGGGVRRDLFNFIDIIALGHGQIWGVQSCGQNFKEHDEKIKSHADSALKWHACGGKVMLIGWRKVKKKRGGKQMVWKPRVKVYKLDDFKEYKPQST